MKFTFSWLKEHLDTTASLDEVVYALTDLGLEVEEVSDPIKKLNHFTIGKILKAKKHDDADKLRVCTVHTDNGETQIICGAPNAREGIFVVVAKPGVYVPGIDTTIGVGKIRGIESHGMMCSEREMELSDEHEGIIELPSADIGEAYGDWLLQNEPEKVDAVVEIAITPNRPDALGVRGIARDLAARGLGALKPMEIHPIPGKFKCPISVSIEPETLINAPVFCGRLIRGVKNGPSPQWLQNKLRAIGLRPISALVDITNFFTYDNNRPLHVFDADKLNGTSIRVHDAKGGEKFNALDDKEYVLSKGMTVISDNVGVESLAGIMGGSGSGCSDNTENVFIEAAYFNPITTAYTGRELKINSDARYRFERGIDPEWTAFGIEAATKMIIELCGGEPSEVIQAGEIPNHSRAYKVDTARIESLVGMAIPADDQLKILENLGFVINDDNARVPSWRPDVQGEADLVEEVARVVSLTKLQGIPLPRVSESVPKSVLSATQIREQTSRRAAAGMGYNECVTYSFIDEKSAKLFGGGDTATQLENPISSEMSHMRPDLLPGLLQAASRNQARGFFNMALFELGPVFNGGDPGNQQMNLSGVLIGQTTSKDVHGQDREVDVFDVKSHIENILSSIGAPSKFQILRGAESYWHPGRHGRVCLGPKKTLGVFGELHPKILSFFDLKGPIVGFTILLDNIPLPRNSKTTRPPLRPRSLQAVERDFAFVVGEKVEALAITTAAMGSKKDIIEDVKVFDEFIGGDLGYGKKSVAITVRLQPIENTLTEAEIEEVSKNIIDRVVSATGGILRS